MMHFIRSALFQLFFYLLTFSLFILFLPGLVLPKPVMHVGFRLWGRGTALLLRVLFGVRWQALNVPKHEGAFIAAGKHQSVWETLVLCLVLKNPAFVLKKELTRLPLFGWYIRKMDMIPIDRSAGSKALRTLLKTAKKAKAAGRPIVIFPEGTRVKPHETLPYQPGVAALYRQLDLPVYPFALNSGLVWPRDDFYRYGGFITVAFQQEIPPGLPKKQILAVLENAIEPATRALVEKPPRAAG
ncbi:MAG: lysophospholipid acyltransferase family protein [Pseudomonadota bacterium]